jgi:hypothetical protein
VIDAAPPPAFSAAGVGRIALGSSYAGLRGAGRIGTLRPGCELTGKGARYARLLGPLQGSVDFTQTTPRRVALITLPGGATARGVGVGATAVQALRAFPHLTVDHRPEQLFGVMLLKVPRRDGGAFQLAVDATSGKVTEIGIPVVAFCE